MPRPVPTSIHHSHPQTSAIDDVYKSVSAAKDPEAVQEGKKILELLARLKYEVEHDRAITYGLPQRSDHCGTFLTPTGPSRTTASPT